MQKFINAPHRGDTPGVPSGSPNAALLIDFDNVTMGIRSDLTAQLKDLLNSDIIRGKVAVQRAYADWRRYAQYIVPLSEASVDLIFAPAYGSSKKNATDIRLAIDALELVFTRPEIGTYILLSGDSDFSSLVLKLKEYGKYVIGVGLRESASDLLVQNCDEYYSYSSLTGLTKAGEEDVVSQHDPWDLVEKAVQQMAGENDVMRSDRLKQVMLDLDPNFDEGEIGYSKFNKFLVEAASRNKLALRKLDNGQYEVQPFENGAAEPKEDRRRGRGGRRGRESTPQARAEPKRESRRSPPKPPAPKPKPAPQTRERKEDDLRAGYELLQRAVRDLIDGPGEGARDSDIKRQMLELEPGWDESELGFTKFSRFLRQAHDAEVIDLQRTAEGYYLAHLPRGGAPAAKAEARGRGRGREERERRTQATQAAPEPRSEETPAERREERERREEPAVQTTEAA
ncbi:MAG: NYN domain-containing protein, partial [Gammaproteobacteria bacterium]|nr:NYN domain-containing protein [Gammaproteobacteria bacterium]